MNVVSSEVWKDVTKSFAEELKGYCDGAAKADVTAASSTNDARIAMMETTGQRMVYREMTKLWVEKLFARRRGRHVSHEKRGKNVKRLISEQLVML